MSPNLAVTARESAPRRTDALLFTGGGVGHAEFDAASDLRDSLPMTATGKILERELSAWTG